MNNPIPLPSQKVSIRRAQRADDLFLGVTLSRHSSSFRFRPEDHIRAADSTFALSRFPVLGQADDATEELTRNSETSNAVELR